MEFFKYLAPGKLPSRKIPNYLSRPFIAESSNIVLGLGPRKTTVKIKNWFADNYLCGERNEEGAFFDLIHLVLFTDVSIQRKIKKENIPPEVNLQFMNLGAMDMILFTDNEMKGDKMVVRLEDCTKHIKLIHQVLVYSNSLPR